VRIPHTLMGVLDVALMLLGLHEWTGIVVRPLGDHIHFQIRVWRDLPATEPGGPVSASSRRG